MTGSKVWPGFVTGIPAAILIGVILPFGWTHPHLTPEQIRARIQELDALIPVVRQSQLELFLERASLHTQLDNLVDSLLDCRRAAFRFPGSPKPYGLSGEILEVRNAYEQAAASYEVSIPLGKPNETMYWRLAVCYREMKRFTVAEAMFRKSAALARDPLVKAARLVDAAKAAESEGDFKGAEEALGESIRLSKAWPSYVETRAEFFMRHRKYRRAAGDYAAIVAKATNGEEEFPMMVRLADALAAAGDAAEARAAYEKAETVITKLLDEDPPFVEDLRFWRGRARLALANHKGAVEDAREALVGLPDQEEYLELMVAIGKAMGETAETRKAAADLKTASEFEEKSLKQFQILKKEVRQQVKQVLEQVTREAMFEAVLEKGLAIMKKDGEKGRKTLALARRKLDALRKAFPDRASVFNYHLARMHLALGENEAALQVIEVSLQEQGENARFRRVRMQAAENLSRVDLVQKDRKFLEDLIERSQDMDLLQPLEAGAGKEGEKK